MSDSRQRVLTWALVAAMAVTAALIAVPEVLEDPTAAVPGVTWLVLVPLFALTEVVVIHLPTQRNAHGHTFREIPAVLGLTFLVPQQYVSAYVVGAVVGLVASAHMRGVKLAFNAAMFALEATLGALTYHAILQGGDPLSFTGWAAVLVAVLVTDLISAAAVTAAISLTEGVLDTEVLREALQSGSVAAFINTCVALLVATLVLVRPSALPLLGVVVVLLVMAYRVYISLARGHAQTRLLYRFVDRTSSQHSSDQVIEVVLRETADLMHAERASLVEVVNRQQVRHHVLADGVHRAGATTSAQPSVWWWKALDGGVVQHERSRSGHDEASPALWSDPVSAPRDGLAAGLRGAGSTRYVLVVCDRSFEQETFGPEEVQAFEALAAHAGVALERARSVSDLEALAQELEVARDAALAASEAKSLFLANMGHEIRTPLTIMLATSEILDDTGLDPLQRSLLERIQRSGGSLKSLVEALLDYSRMESGQPAVSAQQFDLHALLTTTAETYDARARRAGHCFEYYRAPDVPRLVLGDAEKVEKILGNLLDNAVKFTHEGEVGLSVGLPSRMDGSAPEGVELCVLDTGIGIAVEDQASIFDVFSQVDPSATRRYEGTGLGLAAVKQLAEAMGGTVTVDSELGVGSTFVVRLPLVAVATPAATAETLLARAPVAGTPPGVGGIKLAP